MAKYVWYSNATDLTGKALAERLHATAVATKPGNLRAGDVLICWGTKTENDVRIPAGVHVFNQPNAIRHNRDKLGALDILQGNAATRDFVAPYCRSGVINAKLRDNRMKLPLIGRKSHHQGGKGFWLCLSNAQVTKSVYAGAEYFQTYIDIADEYRLHVFKGGVIHAVQKVENSLLNSWVAQRKDFIKSASGAGDIELDEATMDYVLKKLAAEQTLPDYVIRSNKRGWKFSTVNNLPAILRDAAINSVAAVGLDFGAVDCAKDTGTGTFIIEINSGPGLQGVAMDHYVTAFEAAIAALERPPRAEPVRAMAQGRPVRQGQARARVAAVGAENANPVNDDQALELLRVAETDEDRRNVLRLLRRA